MAFTYLGTLATDLDKVRFYLQDVTSGSGPKPADANFTDAELSGLISAEGIWQRAVAAGFETLASAWGKYVTTSHDGLSHSGSDRYQHYAGLAKEWRARYGYYGATGVSGTVRALTRKDGYSDDVDADD